jgi:tRNA threonylcarbamoyladenosine modification (KEOPS) complex  Pcc1 subunit
MKIEINVVIPTERVAENVKQSIWAEHKNIDCDVVGLSGGIS